MTKVSFERVIAHRGACAYAPENTLSAFRHAKTLGARWVEFDVMLSADNIAVVIHDETLERTTNGHGPVAAQSYDALAKLDAGQWFDKRFQGETIPTFSEVMACLSDCQLAANVEIKPYPGTEMKTCDVVVRQIQQHWPTNLLPPLVSSFSWEVLLQARSLDPNLHLGLLMHEWREGWSAQADQIQAVSVHLNEAIASADHVTQIRQTNRAVLAYTVNTASRAQTLYDVGVDAVFSDCPDVILSMSS